MRKLTIIIISALMIIIAGNFFYYKSLYNRQIDYIVKLLDRQVQIAGLSVDNTNNDFVSDLNQIIFLEDISLFFSDEQYRSRTVERMKLFFSKYEDLVTGIKFYDNNRNEFTLKKDETGNNWLEQTFVLHLQGEIMTRETLIKENRNYEYYLPVIKNNVPVGNIVVTLDYQGYFNNLFTAFNFQEYQWQWVLSDSGQVIYNNNTEKIEYTQLQRITQGVEGGVSENLIHRARNSKASREIISSYYSTQLLQKNIGLVFSSPTDKIQKYIIRNSTILGLGTLFLVIFLVYFFRKYIRSQQKEIKRLGASEKMLFSMIEEMPVGVVIHTGDREILKANKKAAEQYSFSDEKEMEGKLFPEISVTDENSYFSKYLGGTFSPDQFVIIKKEAGEIILFRTSIPVSFNDLEATMEMLVDVTMLESARKLEAKANSAKSEFLSRMSYEIRTPLNGIIGMTDILEKKKLPADTKDIVGLLKRSEEALLRIVSDILDFSKIESGKMILEEIPFSLREEILYCHDLARTSIDASTVTFTCNVDENMPDKMIGDPFRLRQILSNLINYSIRNTNKGQIVLKCGLKEVRGGMVMLKFELSDTGKRFDKATLEKIFGNYANVESKVHNDDDESGFGTILARQLIEMMGGEFSAESPSGLEEEKGTKIVFTISAYSNEKPVKDLRFEKIRVFRDIKTLVITGNNSRDEDTLGELHKLGLRVTVTTFQRLTVNQIRTSLDRPDNRYQLIVILNNKEFNGFDAAKEIWESSLSNHFRMIIISSDDVRGNLLKCNTMGIDGYIVHPFETEELYIALKECFPQLDNATVITEKENLPGSLRILVIEDNKMNQKVLGALLRNMGYSPDFADNGFAGFIQAKTHRYDIIFMDLIMPEMDGFESARKIIEYDKNSLIVAFTADNMPDSKRKAELSGIREFIPKPVRIEDLKKLFSRYFARVAGSI